MNFKDIILVYLLLLPIGGYARIKEGVHFLGGAIETLVSIQAAEIYASQGFSRNNALLISEGVFFGGDVILRVASCSAAIHENRYVRRVLQVTPVIQIAISSHSVYRGERWSSKAVATLSIVEGLLRLYDNYQVSRDKVPENNKK